LDIMASSPQQTCQQRGSSIIVEIQPHKSRIRAFSCGLRIFGLGWYL
jgi:hypothetical protein